MEYKNRAQKNTTEDDIDCGGGSAALTIEEDLPKVKEAVLIAKSSIIPYQPVIKSKLEKELEEKGEFKLV